MKSKHTLENRDAGCHIYGESEVNLLSAEVNCLLRLKSKTIHPDKEGGKK